MFPVMAQAKARTATVARKPEKKPPVPPGTAEGYGARHQPLRPDRLTERILYRDGLMLVIDKPAGIAVHPGPGGGPQYP